MVCYSLLCDYHHSEVLMVGELEETISKTFTKSSNLRAMMLKDGCPPAIKNCQGHFGKLVDSAVRNTLLTDISHFLVDIEEPPVEEVSGMTTIPELIHGALRSFYHNLQAETPRVAKSLRYFTMKGLTFSSFKRHPGNGSIMVRQRSGSSLPAIIEGIIQISTTEILFAVRHLLRTTSTDPFIIYRELQASLWSHHTGQVVIIKPEDVDCHFASLPMEWEGANCVAVISLSRVSVLFFLYRTIVN